MMKIFITLFKTESRLVLRGIDTLFFGIGFPVIVALFMGILMKGTPTFDSSFAAVSTIGICATGLMGMPLTLSDYRHRHILKRYSVTPLSPQLILMAQAIINIVIAFISLLVVYLIMTLCFGFTFQGNVFLFLISFLLIAFAMFGFGMMIASISRDMKMANLLCTLIYFPMIFLSGTVIPYDVMPAFLQNIMDFVPLKIGIDLLNHFALNMSMDTMVPIVTLLAIGGICIIISIQKFRWV